MARMIKFTANWTQTDDDDAAVFAVARQEATGFWAPRVHLWQRAPFGGEWETRMDVPADAVPTLIAALAQMLPPLTPKEEEES